MQLAIIGAGMAGLACADRLVGNGCSVTLFDKGRGPGGRMSTRRVETPAGTASFDHGAQYFTARDPQFRARVAEWAMAGIVAPWPEAGKDAWVGVPSMNAPIRAMAAAHDVRFGCHVAGIQRNDTGWWVRHDSVVEGPFDVAVLAIPAEQASALLALHDLDMARTATTARSLPCWTAMAAFTQRVDIRPDHLPSGPVIGWAARNNAKPQRSGPESWVIQATGGWSADRLEQDAADVAPLLLEALRDHSDSGLLPPLAHLSAHRWRFAMTRGIDHGPLWNDRLALGACGDWLLGPRVELAWLSGRRLAIQIAADMAAAQAERP
ncbi:hypothetical protein J3E64_000763 [Sphingobium sp. OAS761]|uniref:NAD(P)/FAD-dependent oxidoreductase n=1 Tax=Sphingobium sp. OAS761 TaxID=2817901 RepID=UPI00209D1AAD|nr:NAD(P)-binding protein [Sphingobium sp. OAS761]MCP1469092.1 hypothetical protein [Sphingobium sp. OAS761]